MVPQNFSGNIKVEPLQGAPILHRGDLNKVPVFVELPKQIFQAANYLGDFCMCPSSISRGIFQLCFMMRKVSVREASPRLVQGIESPGPSGRSPRTILKCSILPYPDEAKKPPCLPVYWYTMSEEKLIQFRNL